MEGSLEELRARLAEVDDRLALKLAEKDESARRTEELKNEARAINAERDPLAEQVAKLEREAREADGVPLTTIGPGE